MEFYVVLICLVIFYYLAIVEKLENRTLKAMVYTIFLINGFWLGCYYVQDSKYRIPTAQDLLRGDVKVEVVRIAVNGEEISTDTIYTLKERLKKDE